MTILQEIAILAGHIILIEEKSALGFSLLEIIDPEAGSSISYDQIVIIEDLSICGIEEISDRSFFFILLIEEMKTDEIGKDLLSFVVQQEISIRKLIFDDKMHFYTPCFSTSFRNDNSSATYFSCSS